MTEEEHIESKTGIALPTIRIGLLWHSLNSDNLGVGALTIGNMALLREAAMRNGFEAHFVILGWHDPRPDYALSDDVEIVRLRLKDFVQPVGGLLSKIRQCDVLVDIGAGDSFTDIYGPKRFLTTVIPKFMAWSVRRPLVLAPQTIGPFDRWWSRRIGLMAIQLASAVAVRDDLSATFLRDLGFRGQITQASDVALHLPFKLPDNKPRDGKLRVGLNVSGLLVNGGYNRRNMFGTLAKYEETIRELLQMLSARKDLEIHLVPHVISDTIAVEDDYRVNLALAEDFPSVIVAPRFEDPISAKSYISGLDAFAGARMHACIAAFSSCVPVLPMAYSRKFAGVFGALGYTQLADLKSDSTAEIVSKFERLLEDRSKIQAEMKEAIERGRTRLASYSDVVSSVLAPPHLARKR